MDPSMEQLNVGYERLRCVIEKQEKKVESLEIRAGVTAAAYILLECMILQSISSPSVAVREKWWIPLSLSLSVSVIFWLSFTTSVLALLRTRYQHDLSLMEQDTVYLRIHSLRHASSTTTTRHHKLPVRLPLKPDALACYQRYAYVCVMLSALLCFTALMLYACGSILRDAQGSQPVG